jgi:hypothetical protein
MFRGQKGDSSRKMAENQPLLGGEPESRSRTVERPSNWKEAQKLGYKPQYSSEEVKKEIQKGFLLKVYGILCAQLAFTVAFCALFMMVEPLRTFVLGNVWIVIVLFIVSIVLIICLFFLKNTYPWFVFDEL